MRRLLLPFMFASLVVVSALPIGAQMTTTDGGQPATRQAAARKTPTPTQSARTEPAATPIAPAQPDSEPSAPPPSPTEPPATPPAPDSPTPTVAKAAAAGSASPAPPELPKGGQLLVAPTTMTAGGDLEVAAKGFGQREPLAVWLTSPTGEAIAVADQTTGKDGQAYFTVAIPGDTGHGRWAATVHGRVSGRQAIAAFMVAGPASDPQHAASTPSPPSAADAAAPAKPTEDPANAPLATATPAEPSLPTATPTPTATPVDNSDIAGLLPPDRPDAALSPRLARSYFGAASRMTGVPVEILLAVAAVESGFRPNAVGPSIPQYAGTIDEHALGMMQFLPSTYRPYAPIVDRITGKRLGMRGLWDPESAVYAAAFYLRDNGAPGDMRGALFRYNNADWYVRLVLAWADYYAKGGEIGGAPVIDRDQIYALPDPAAPLSTGNVGAIGLGVGGQAGHGVRLTTGLAELLGLVGDRLDWPRLQRPSRIMPH